MKRTDRQSGFSLTEMLIATGIMAIGLVMVATVFPVGVKLTSLASERAIGAVAADEAFAKIQLYGLRNFEYWPAAQIYKFGGLPDPAATYTRSDSYLYANLFALGPDKLFGTADDFSAPLDTTWRETFYPSTVLSAAEKQRYHWSALCRRVGLKEVQVTVFVSRKTSNINNYRTWTCNAVNTAFTAGQSGQWPSPIKVSVLYDASQPRQLTFNSEDAVNKEWDSAADNVSRFFNEGFTIIDDQTGQVYRITEYEDSDDDLIRDTLVLDRNWEPNVTAGSAEYIWVVPPAVNSDRYPCVGVYQRVLYFENIQ